MNEIISRIEELRKKMALINIDAYIIYGTDPHLSEYLPDYWQTREFISGFTGSAGTVIILKNKAALWTDSRYFIQAEKQIKNTGIELMKLRTPGYPEQLEWLELNLKPGMKVGVDEWCISENNFKKLKSGLNKNGIELIEVGDILENIWIDRPKMPLTEIYEHDLKYAGISRGDKIKSVLQELKNKRADLQVLSALDDIAWLFNLRGNDVEYNPVFMAWAVISASETVLFIENNKISTALQSKIRNEQINIKDYNEIESFLQSLSDSVSILIDADKTNHAIFNSLPAKSIIINSISIPCKLKSRKTCIEIRNIKNAMKKDGAALIEFLFWLKINLGKIDISEFTIAEKLCEFRKKQENYKGLSFYPIVGYKEHGAIVHFHVQKSNALNISNEGFLLFDSGGQYLDGTTDITRTIALSELSAAQKSDFTLVLKGMIALSSAIFPVNTKGYHLDILARKDLWSNGLNYGHGTGHGVGFFLNVHEGPMSIRQEFNDCPIEEGMVLSNEPALYRDGLYGIRTENLIYCTNKNSGNYGDFLGFETLTLCPIDTNAIDKNLLTPDEIIWLNSYHEKVYDELKELLSEELKQFLQELTKPI